MMADVIRPGTPLRPGVMPLSEFSPEGRRRIEEQVARPRPPAQWRTVCDGMAQIVSRGWYEWYWARGIDPDKRRRSLPSWLREAIITRDGLVCGLCGGDVELGDVHIDHIKPVIQGGTDNPNNLQVSHSKCNIRKGGR